MKSYILLDRTGSMADKWEETLSAVNGYAKELKKEGVKTQITLAAFDFTSGTQFDILRRNVKPGDWESVTSEEVEPRGWTPLYDAIGQLITLAEEDASKKATIIIMTDGHENSSKEHTKETIKFALDRCRTKHKWDVVFLGVEFDNFGQASGLGNLYGQTIQTTTAGLASTAETFAVRASNYSGTGDPMGEFTEEERQKASK